MNPFLFYRIIGIIIMVILLSRMEADNSHAADIIGHPVYYIEVHQKDGKVIFDFFVLDKWWSDKPGTDKIPADVGAFMIAKKDGAIVWDIHSRDGRKRAKSIQYGIIPEGFEQWIPAKQNPALLENGNEYRAVAYSGGAGEVTFNYEGPGKKEK